MESVTAAIESAVGLEESFHWLFLRMDVGRYKSSLGQGIGRAASTPPFDKLPFLFGHWT